MVEQRKVVDFSDEADLGDPSQHIAWAMTQWPAVGKMKEQPAVRPVVPFHSEFLVKLGFRWHPEKATLFKVRDPVNPGRAKFLSREEYEEYQAKYDGNVDEGVANEAALKLLARMDPNRAEAIKSMSDEERTAERDASADGAAKAMEYLMSVRDTLKVKPDDGCDT